MERHDTILRHSKGKYINTKTPTDKQKPRAAVPGGGHVGNCSKSLKIFVILALAKYAQCALFITLLAGSLNNNNKTFALFLLSPSE